MEKVKISFKSIIKAKLEKVVRHSRCCRVTGVSSSGKNTSVSVLCERSGRELLKTLPLVWLTWIQIRLF